MKGSSKNKANSVKGAQGKAEGPSLGTGPLLLRGGLDRNHATAATHIAAGQDGGAKWVTAQRRIEKAMKEHHNRIRRMILEERFLRYLAEHRVQEEETLKRVRRARSQRQRRSRQPQRKRMELAKPELPTIQEDTSSTRQSLMSRLRSRIAKSFQCIRRNRSD